MITKQNIEVLDLLINNVSEMVDWVNLYLKSSERAEAFKSLVEQRRLLKRTYRSLKANPTIAAYGESQKGKSYIISSLLSSPGNPLKVKDENGKMLDFIENFNFNTADSVIVKVIAYVKANYTQDLKLEVLGQMFNCNSAYLGKRFKKYTGQQFNTYLDNLRIEDAKDKLLNTDLKIYQISKLVGYAKTDYFFMKFYFYFMESYC